MNAWWTPEVTVALITLAIVVINGGFAWLARQDARAARLHAEATLVEARATREDVKVLEKNTNHIQDVLNATKDAATKVAVKASRAEGFLEGREERNDKEEEGQGGQQ